MRYLLVWLLACMCAASMGLMMGHKDPADYVIAFAWIGHGVAACWITRRGLT